MSAKDSHHREVNDPWQALYDTLHALQHYLAVYPALESMHLALMAQRPGSPFILGDDMNWNYALAIAFPLCIGVTYYALAIAFLLCIGVAYDKVLILCSLRPLGIEVLIAISLGYSSGVLGIFRYYYPPSKLSWLIFSIFAIRKKADWMSIVKWILAYAIGVQCGVHMFDNMVVVHGTRSFLSWISTGT
jgi:hypothetical protein